VFQDPYSSLDPRMRVGEIIDEALRHEDLSAAERRAEVHRALEDVALAGRYARFPHELSGGQRQRVAIARALIRRPEFILADEPVSALDMTIQKQVLSLLRELQVKRGFSCLFVSHDLAAVEEIADRIAVMHRGEIVEIGTRDEVLDHPRHPYTRALLEASPRIEAVCQGRYRHVIERDRLCDG
jgi:peptide/nickel transport system ATP-binding protein